MPLSPGLYFANTADWGCRDTSPASCLGITIPVVTWSTPWTVLGARVQFFSVTPLIETGASTPPTTPAFTIRLCWGNWLGTSATDLALVMPSAYFDIDQQVAWSSNSLNQRFALSYTGNDWNLTVNVIYGIQLDEVTRKSHRARLRSASTAAIRISLISI
jgi:hypothetical protein